MATTLESEQPVEHEDEQEPTPTEGASKGYKEFSDEQVEAKYKYILAYKKFDAAEKAVEAAKAAGTMTEALAEAMAAAKREGQGLRGTSVGSLASSRPDEPEPEVVKDSSRPRGQKGSAPVEVATEKNYNHDGRRRKKRKNQGRAKPVVAATYEKDVIKYENRQVAGESQSARESRYKDDFKTVLNDKYSIHASDACDKYLAECGNDSKPSAVHTYDPEQDEYVMQHPLSFWSWPEDNEDTDVEEVEEEEAALDDAGGVEDVDEEEAALDDDGDDEDDAVDVPDDELQANAEEIELLLQGRPHQRWNLSNQVLPPGAALFNNAHIDKSHNDYKGANVYPHATINNNHYAAPAPAPDPAHDILLKSILSGVDEIKTVANQTHSVAQNSNASLQQIQEELPANFDNVQEAIKKSTPLRSSSGSFDRDSAGQVNLDERLHSGGGVNSMPSTPAQARAPSSAPPSTRSSKASSSKSNPKRPPSSTRKRPPSNAPKSTPSNAKRPPKPPSSQRKTSSSSKAPYYPFDGKIPCIRTTGGRCPKCTEDVYCKSHKNWPKHP